TLAPYTSLFRSRHNIPARRHCILRCIWFAAWKTELSAGNRCILLRSEVSDARAEGPTCFLAGGDVHRQSKSSLLSCRRRSAFNRRVELRKNRARSAWILSDRVRGGPGVVIPTQNGERHVRRTGRRYVLRRRTPDHQGPGERHRARDPNELPFHVHDLSLSRDARTIGPR